MRKLGLVFVVALACNGDGGSDDAGGSETGGDPVCGNGVIEAGEQCDSTNFGQISCTTLGLGPGQLQCSVQCQIDASGCCGDGILGPAEDCDDGNSMAGDGCNGVCQLEDGFDCTGLPSVCTAVCGDGLVTPVEGCDDANSTPGDGCTMCQVTPGWTCTGQPSACSKSCGNGSVEAGEDCDGSVPASVTCESGGHAPGGTVACDSNCHFDYDGCEDCGNGVADFFEDCDGTDLGFDTCATLGFGGGTVACTAECTYDTRGCNGCGDGVIDPTEGEQCDPPDGRTCDDACQTIACAQCSDLLGASTDTACCGAAQAYDALSSCVCFGATSACQTACADTLCVAADVSGDDCETCLQGADACSELYDGCAALMTLPLATVEDSAALCADGCDNDEDTVSDCADPGCYGVGACGDAETVCNDLADNDLDGVLDCNDPDCAASTFCDCTPDDGGTPADFELGAGNDTLADAADLSAYLTTPLDATVQTVGGAMVATTIAVCGADPDYYLLPDAALAEPCNLEVTIAGLAASTDWDGELLDTMATSLDSASGDASIQLTHTSTGTEDVVIRVGNGAPMPASGVPYELQLRCAP